MVAIRRRFRTSATRVILALTMAGAAMFLAPAAHASSCDGGGCSGQDPIAAGCAADAYTPSGATVSTPQGFVELRYSPSCHANWARISNSSPGTWFFVQDCNSGEIQDFHVPSGSNSGYTNMVDGYPPAMAGDSDGQTGCF
jgi:hypothetical protein